MTSLRQWFADIHGTQEIKNDPRQQWEETSRLLQRATHSKWRCLGRPHSMKASRNASCTDAKIRLFNGIDSVVEGTRTMTTLVSHTTTNSQPACKFLQRVLNKSVVRQTGYQCNTDWVWRECAVESARHKCHVCNLRGSHLSQSVRILATIAMCCAARLYFKVR